ncbi:MAG: polysaccharide biosynthesis C-terminal domain-containing protein [Ignavibacteria bacterium]|nr:polysaccharide biosynthesis C-terminal domain-containing protein [Ignavibacteria bacterium]
MLDKLKSLSKDTLIYGTSTILGRFLNFLFVPIYTNLFLPSDFGIVANIYAYIAILNVFFTVGLESGFFKFASTLEVGDKKENFSHPFFGIFLNSAVLSGILYAFSHDFTYLFQIDPGKDVILKYTALILFFDALSIVPFGFLRLTHKPYMFAFIRLAGIVLTVILNILFIVVLKFGIEYVFISNLIASFFTLLLLLPVILRNIKFSLNMILVKELLRFSLPYIPAGISSNIIQVINRPILTALTDDHTVGVFQANYRLGIFMMLFVSMFEFAWQPFFLNNAKEPDAKALFSKVMTMFLVAATVIFVFLTFFIDDIVAIPMPGKGYLVGKAYWGGLQIVPVILLSYLIYGMYLNFMAGIYIEKKTKYLPYITGTAAVVNIAANFILIPVFGMMGAAIATLMSYISMTAGIYFTSRKFYRIDYQKSKLISIGVILSVSIVIYYATRNIDNILIDIGSFLLILSSFFLFRIIDINTVKRFLK